MSFLTCSRPDPSSKMGSSAAAVSSSVCIFLPFPCLLPPPYNRPRAAPTQVTSEVMGLPGGNGGEAGSTVTPSAAASRCPISRWRGLRQMSLIGCCGRRWWCPSRVSSSSRSCDPAHRLCGTRSIPRLPASKDKTRNERPGGAAAVGPRRRDSGKRFTVSTAAASAHWAPYRVVAREGAWPAAQESERTRSGKFYPSFDLLEGGTREKRPSDDKN